MKKFSIFLLLLVLVQTQTSAQFLKENNFFDASFSTLGSQSALSANYHHLHGLGKAKKFSVGYGVRFTSNYGKKVDFITAPAKLTSGSTGLGVIFTENKLENFDTLSLAKYAVNTLNLSIHLNYKFHPKWDVEFNIDALGFSFGKQQTADYLSSKRLSSPNQDTKQKVKPTSFNLLLVSDNDLGSLNSEILLHYWFKPKWTLKLGASFVFAEYTSENKLFLDNNRFRNKALMGMFGITYSPFTN